jgi:hypothetical protein
VGEERKVYKVWVGKPEGKRPLGRLRHRWEDWIKMNLTEICWEGVEWNHLAGYRDWWWALVNMVMNLQILMPPSYLVPIGVQHFLYVFCRMKMEDGVLLAACIKSLSQMLLKG